MWISPEFPHIFWTGLKSRPRYKSLQSLSSRFALPLNNKSKERRVFWGHGRISNLTPYTKRADGYLAKSLANPILDSAFCSDRESVRGSPRDFLSLSPLLLFHFLPANGKTGITPLKSMALQGPKLLCWNKWKTRAAVAEWDTARSRVSPASWGSALGRRHGSLHEQTARRPAEKCRVRHSARMIHGGKL